MTPALARRAVRYGVAGALTTLVAYAATMLMLRVTNYVAATVVAWVLALAFGFALNRRFTFGISGPDKRVRDLALFAASALAQLAITLADYSVMLGRLGLAPTLAFAINLAATTAFGFAFLNLVAFRRAI